MRLHESMLFDPITERTNFCARKFTSFDALEQLNMPKERVVSCVARTGQPGGRDVERLVPARGPQHAVLAHQRLGQPTAVLAQSDHLLPWIRKPQGKGNRSGPDNASESAR